MLRLLKSFFFRLKHDLTFRITAFIGLGLSIIIPLVYFSLDLGSYLINLSGNPDPEPFKATFCTGQALFVGSLSPVQNFGIAIPINLVSFIVLEFNHGTVRNKIVSGHSKLAVYLSLVISAIILSLLFIVGYTALSTGFGSLFGLGGFDMNGLAGLSGVMNLEYFIKVTILTILIYITIAAMVTFFAGMFRNIGPSIAVVILIILGVYLSGTLVGTISGLFPDQEVIKFITTMFKILNPMYGLSNTGTDILTGGKLTIDNLTFISGIITNLLCTAAFVGFGALIFTKTDVK